MDKKSSKPKLLKIPPVTEDELITLCKAYGVTFVNRSHGKMTTGTVSLSTIKQIVDDAVRSTMATTVFMMTGPNPEPQEPDYDMAKGM